MSTFAKFAPLLRKAKFRKTWTSRAGGVRIDEWKREEPDGRTLVCQLWADGEHRINHEWVGCSDTVPTDFADEQGFAAAVQRESTRTDGRYRDPDNHHHEPSRAFLRAKMAAANPAVTRTEG